MTAVLRVFAVLLLLFNGIGAVYGGWLLMKDPSGQQLQLPPGFLSGSLFDDYFVPGLVLFTANGLLSLTFAAFVIFNHRHYPKMIFVQGLVLCGWIIVQTFLVKYVYYLHFVMGGTGVLLLLLGILLHKRQRKQKPLVA